MKRPYLTCWLVMMVALAAGPAWSQQAPPPKRMEVQVAPADRTPDRLAHLFAPVLWLSEDEKFVPSRLPNECGEDEAVPVDPDAPFQYTIKGIEPPQPQEPRPAVYYAIQDLSSEQPPRELTVRYWFYYPDEVGYHAHEHDLERVDVHIVAREGGAYAVDSMIGAAHGSRWFENQLIDAEIPYPPMVFVEEGKHATCPDRTGDGRYTPGDDINRSVSNAWGVRDIMGAGFMGSSPQYHGHMTKERDERWILVPHVSEVMEEVQGRFGHPLDAKDTYDLISAQALQETGQCGDPEGVVNVMRRRILGKQGQVPVLSAALDPILPVYPVDVLGVRFDQSRVLGTFNYPLGYQIQRYFHVGLPGEFNAMVHYDFDVNRAGINALYTPTIAYWWTWYAMFGVEPDSPSLDNREAMEIGFRARVPTLKDRWTHKVGFLAGFLNFLVPEMAGVRLGVRVNDFDRFQNERLVLEVGSGLW